MTEQQKREAEEESAWLASRPVERTSATRISFAQGFDAALSTQAEELKEAKKHLSGWASQYNALSISAGKAIADLNRVKGELAAVRDELSDMEFEAANLTDGADWQERSMRLKHRVSLLGSKLDALLK